MKKLIVAFSITALVFLAGYAAVHAAAGDRRYTRPGLMVRVGNHRLNLYCFGTGSPVVVFDSGWEDWAPAWAIVQPAVARWTRTCTYDRAGAGFSDPGPMPRTSVRIADDLHAALLRAAIPAPYILVGHSFGSYNMRAFVDRYPNDVAGLVLVDGEDGDVLSPRERRRMDRDFVKPVAELRACRAALAAGKPLPRLPSTPGKPGPDCSQQFFRGIPERMFSQQLNATILHIARTRLALYDEVISEMEWMPWDETYLQTHRRTLGSRPVRVLTAQNHFYDTPKTPPALHREHLTFERGEAAAQARWLTLSSDAKQIFAYRSGHYIELDQPYIVIDAIRDVYTSTRRR
jgi:pimeloyl-ACP methyl ester carboxylesterase